jgi:mRNA interferase RelE/StbE
MIYIVEVERKAAKALEKINDPDYNRIKMAILNLANDPRPYGYIKLRGREAYRIIVGTYRIIYEIIDNRLIVNVVTIGHRKDVYR